MTSTRSLAVVPAYQAERTIEAVVQGLIKEFDQVWVVDDGSTDNTGRLASLAGARVIRHAGNRGKSAALRTALLEAAGEKFETFVTVDADGQHPPQEAIRLHRAVPDPNQLVLGVRDLIGANAPRANIRSNSIANWWISYFSNRPLRDTQCGLRRYPVRATLALGVKGERYTFETEVILRAIRANIPITEIPVQVIYPADRTTHFDSVKDPIRIIIRVLSTVAQLKLSRP